MTLLNLYINVGQRIKENQNLWKQYLLGDHQSTANYNN
jgi:hypothetical protein